MDRTVFAPQSRVSGLVSGEDIVLLGSFRGEARGSHIQVDPSGQVDASLECEVAEIFGHFRGAIDAKVLHFGSGAVASGTFRAARLIISEGAVVNGAFNLDLATASAHPVSDEATRASLTGETWDRVEAPVDIDAVEALRTAS